jgi:protein-disulfide isomerase
MIRRVLEASAFVCTLTFLIARGLPVAGQTPTPQKPEASASAKSDALAEVEGVAITSEEIDKSLGVQLSKLQEQIYNLKRQRLDATIAEVLLVNEAAKRGITVAALLDAEVTAKVGVVTEQEIDTFYEANKARLKGDETSLREQIRSYLQTQKLSPERDAFLRRLRSRASVAVYLKPPPAPKIEMNLASAPFVGAADAKVTIVEFSDFHCPFCKRVEDTLAQIRERYGDRVKLVWRDNPIDQLHPQSRKAHEAARCAAEQDKFWEYHRALFAGTPKPPDQLKPLAQQAGLDLERFDQCVASARYQAVVQKDVEEGLRLGVNGTPAFFINGRMLSGAQPIESFVRIIEDELARKAAPKGDQ